MATRRKPHDARAAHFALRSEKKLKELLVPLTHIYHNGARCETETRGFPTPGNRSPRELVLDATNGFIPLWDRDVTLNWRFQEHALLAFAAPEAVKDYVRDLLGEAILAWGAAVPVRFSETPEPWDFEIVVRAEDNCNPAGCTLARAFFPDSGQHELVLFPRMFQQNRDEQRETLAHELGHVFGLRHFFAQVSETSLPSVIFGEHVKFSIMNYGPESILTATDIADLARLYEEVWSGRLTSINGTPIRLVRPFSSFRQRPFLAVAASAAA